MTNEDNKSLINDLMKYAEKQGKTLQEVFVEAVELWIEDTKKEKSPS